MSEKGCSSLKKKKNVVPLLRANNIHAASSPDSCLRLFHDDMFKLQALVSSYSPALTDARKATPPSRLVQWRRLLFSFIRHGQLRVEKHCIQRRVIADRPLGGPASTHERVRTCFMCYCYFILKTWMILHKITEANRKKKLENRHLHTFFSVYRYFFTVALLKHFKASNQCYQWILDWKQSI